VISLRLDGTSDMCLIVLCRTTCWLSRLVLWWSTLQRSRWKAQRALAMSIVVYGGCAVVCSVQSSCVKSVCPIVSAMFLRKVVICGQSKS